MYRGNSLKMDIHRVTDSIISAVSLFFHVWNRLQKHKMHIFFLIDTILKRLSIAGQTIHVSAPSKQCPITKLNPQRCLCRTGRLLYWLRKHSAEKHVLTITKSTIANHHSSRTLTSIWWLLCVRRLLQNKLYKWLKKQTKKYYKFRTFYISLFIHLF